MIKSWRELFTPSSLAPSSPHVLLPLSPRLSLHLGVECLLHPLILLMQLSSTPPSCPVCPPSDPRQLLPHDVVVSVDSFAVSRSPEVSRVSHHCAAQAASWIPRSIRRPSWNHLKCISMKKRKIIKGVELHRVGSQATVKGFQVCL